MPLKHRLQQLPGFRVLNIPRRAHMTAKAYVGPFIGAWARWLITSKEDTNFTYELSDVCRQNLEHGLSLVLDVDVLQVREYFDEILEDRNLTDHIRRFSTSGVRKNRADAHVRFGRRIAWYAIVRIKKPKIVVETGVEKGLGSVVICAALLRNRDEGHNGQHFGTDIAPDAGQLLTSNYSEVGKVLYGDSIKTLSSFPDKIDVFINDSDHSAEYEAREYEVISNKLSDNFLIVGDNSHVTNKLAKFSEKRGLKYIFLNEVPKNHWYAGAGVGLAFGQRLPPSNADERPTRLD